MGHEAVSIDHGVGSELATDVAALLGSDDPRHVAFDDQQRLSLLRHRDQLVGLSVRIAGRLRGYGQLQPDGAGWGLAVICVPDPGGGPGLEARILHAARSVVAADGGGHLAVWARAGNEAMARALATDGFSVERALLQLRAPLPLGPAADAAREAKAGAGLRSFLIGVDEDAWLAVNNAAFAGHVEQAGWDRSKLADRQAEPWFDPEGFVVLEDEGTLIGSCWTKVHADHLPPMGEIYVISVDPAHAGQGLGAVLAVAGLDRLAARGLTLGMLYVEADNAPARRLYERLGFTLHHTDERYAITVEPSPG